MTQVITAEQARAITGGRKPLVPVEYEEACLALEACLTIEDAKYWSDKADALAAWAKIYRDDKAGRDAKALKLRAYRSMGQLAKELRPQKAWNKPGPKSILREQGLNSSSAGASLRLSKLNEKQIEKLTSLPRPPAPTSHYLLRNPYDKEANNKRRAFGEHKDWIEFWSRFSIASSMLKFDASALARSVAPESLTKVKEKIRCVTDWLDEFDRHLPK